ncbi:vancomycin resistance protein [Sporosarcina sp. P18a]|uniref:YdcF family protein n=1 Tax=unclassified Sporosarcina TaxID=2647733 RepID=UPI000C16FF19|nr:MULTISPECIES: YdcF family protein [unclassified Sporosarcina]PIC71480.1 vancomycin resistance protein [Sporosarcina sp. P16b]PIC80305.1 vancomycin resistance protein [Sporosarcina sp. P18a]
MKKLWRIIVLAVLIIAGLGMFWMLPGERIKQAQQMKANGKYDYAIILGAKVNGEVPSLSLRYRLESAVEYATQFPHVQLVLAGGQGKDEDISEAEAMYRFLQQHGIAKERLVMEDQSTSTNENLQFSQNIIPEVAGVTIISSDYHLARARFLARQIGWESDVVAAKTPESIKAKVLIRERLALLKTWLFRR